jgi:signal transduction histidine kinase
VHPLAIAGFLGALGVAHAVVAVYSLFLFRRSARPVAPRAGRATAPPRPDRELLVFGLMNLAVVALDGGLASAYASARPALSLAVAEGGRVAALVLLLHFLLQYARARRPAWVVAALYAAGALLEVASALGLVERFGQAGIEAARVAGAEIPVVHVPVTALGVAFTIASVAGTLAALALLGGAFLRGRREAPAFLGMTLLAVTTLHDALGDLGVVRSPPLAELGYAALVNGVMMTLLSRFTALRGQLEARARELRDRSRALGRSYEELRAAQDELVRKEQLAAVGELSAVVAHEVRNPLAIISNAVATLRRAGVSDEDRATLLTILDEESSRLNRLVGDLLRYARPVNIERQLVSLRELVERSLVLAEGHPDLSAELLEAEPVDRVWADAGLVRQVLDNLVSNALQAMQAGGVLTVTLLNVERDGARGVEIQIQDTGEGMNTEVRARALDPFFTTRPSGTGLGLAIVARIVDAHGGALRIRSSAGAGTVMHVFLPLAGEPPPRRPGGSDRPERWSSEPPLPRELKKAIGSPGQR